MIMLLMNVVILDSFKISETEYQLENILLT